MSKVEFIKKVAKIQKELKAPKSQYNNFGKYSYRNKEDILEAAKTLLGDLVLTVSDEIVEIGGRVYVKATSTITDGEFSLTSTGYAREASEQKGMNDSQITGSTSSYAGKYSLNGLFLIDDTKDADSDEVTAKTRGVEMPTKTAPVKATFASTPTQGSVSAQPSPEEKVVAANPDNAVNAVPKTGKAGWGAPKKKVETSSSEGMY